MTALQRKWEAALGFAMRMVLGCILMGVALVLIVSYVHWVLTEEEA